MKKSTLIFLAIVAFILVGGPLFAQETVEETLSGFQNAFDMIWLVLAAALVFLMQAGFAMVETGLTRAKNAGNIIMKNLMDFSVGALFFWAIGWAIMYGASYAGEGGNMGFFLSYGEGYDIPSIFRDWMFQVVFAATAATIVSGAMAERTKFSGYLAYSVFISGLIYPLFGSWTWGGQAVFGLYSLGDMFGTSFHDFAGSTIVHSVGGWAALAGAIILGARKGKYIKDASGKVKVNAILGHNLPLAALGVFILWFGWFGFNAGSTLSGTDPDIAHVAITTTLSASAGAIAAMVTIWIIGGKPDPSMSLNGALAGLVAITAGCWVINPAMSIVVGLIAGILVVLSVEFFDKILHIDDPVGAVSVHGVCGAFGTLAVGLFADGSKVVELSDGTEKAITGLFFGGGGAQLGVQFIGVITAMIFVFAAAMVLFLIIKNTIGLRVSEKEELKGLDIEEHGAEAYAGFQIFSNQ